MSRFVLVHGAFHNATCWERLKKDLEARGHRVEAVDLPGQGADKTPLEQVTLDLYADKVTDVIMSDPEPAILVGHSMGGMVVTQAADNFVADGGDLAQVVYLTAFLPRNGQSLMDLTGMPEGQGDSVQENLQVSGEPPIGTFPAEAAKEALFNETSDEMMKTLPPSSMESQPIIPFLNPVHITDDRPLNRKYIFALNDRANPIALQRKMAGATAVSESAELDSDHMPVYSRQAETIEILDRFARS